MEQMTFGQRLKALRKQRNMSQADAGAAIGLTQTAYGRYETGSRDPDTQTLTALAQLFGVTVDYLMGVSGTAELRPSGDLPSNLRPMADMPYYYIPVARGVAAGMPVYMEGNYCVYVDSPRQADFALILEDDSMAGGYLKGDVVYIKSVGTVDDGTIAAVAVDGKCVLRRFYRIKNGIQLTCDDPRYSPVVLLSEDAEAVQVMGVPVGYTRMFKKEG